MEKDSERRQFRHTKIICTIGPACDTSHTLKRMAMAGMNIARLNFSHGDHESHLMAVRRIKSLNQKLNHPISILVDLQGPEIRTGELQNALELKVGETFSLSVSPVTDPEQRSVHVDYRSLVNDLKKGDKVTVDNGLINLEVLEVHEYRLVCRVLDGGKLGSRKHINLPGIRVNLPSITEKDRRDIQFAMKHELDFIALSFVRSPSDVVEARQLLEQGEANIKLIAKIENQEGVDNFSEILEVADGIMVARGDLGVEVDFRDLPVIQRRIVRECSRVGKPVIVATHLLESMRDAPMPTRAETTDVANAVYEQADAIMLSGETASGKYPVRCVEVMDGIAKRIEREPGLGFYLDRKPADAREEIARSACRVADSLNAPAIVVITRRGLLGQLVASYRPQRAIIYAFTNMSSVRRKLWLNRSVVPFVIDFSKNAEKTIQTALEKLAQRNRVMPGDPVVVITDVMGMSVSIPSIQVRRFGETMAVDETPPVVAEPV
ncbi:MAG TPA: pyruvate kinase [Polyangiaceae bacterium]|nr:pyruvate kinase [Polyangiaceae bacterium]